MIKVSPAWWVQRLDRARQGPQAYRLFNNQ